MCTRGVLSSQPHSQPKNLRTFHQKYRKMWNSSFGFSELSGRKNQQILILLNTEPSGRCNMSSNTRDRKDKSNELREHHIICRSKDDVPTRASSSREALMPCARGGASSVLEVSTDGTFLSASGFTSTGGRVMTGGRAITVPGTVAPTGSWPTSASSSAKAWAASGGNPSVSRFDTGGGTKPVRPDAMTQNNWYH